MSSRAALVFSLLISTSLLAQTERQAPASSETAAPPRQLRVISQAWAQNYVPKYDSDGVLGSSGIYESSTGFVGIGTATPEGRLQVFEDVDSQTAGIVRNPNVGTNAAAALVARSDGAAINLLAHGSARTLSRYGFSLGGWTELRASLGSGLAVGTTHNAPLIFGTNNVEQMRILPTGGIVVGGSAPQGRFTVWGSATNSATNNAAYFQQHGSLTSGTEQTDRGMVAEVLQNVKNGITNIGGMEGIRGHVFNVGQGTIQWATASMFFVGNGTGSITNAYAVQAHVSKGSGTIDNGYGVYVGNIEATAAYGVYQLAADDTNYFAGKTIIGGAPTTTSQYALAVQGNAHFNGTVTGTNIKAKYQDLAEWVPASDDLAPGTVVVLNPKRTNEVMASHGAYDTTVAGVVSAAPGISLGEEGDGKEQIATTGRVKVRVDARQHAVAVGDLLVTSEIPGTAMRSEPMLINGRKFHQPGTIIGKALEPLEGGIGEILVLLSMQ